MHKYGYTQNTYIGPHKKRFSSLKRRIERFCSSAKNRRVPFVYITNLLIYTSPSYHNRHSGKLAGSGQRYAACVQDFLQDKEIFRRRAVAQ